MELQIRQMTLADLDQVMEIEPVAFGSHHWSRQSFINEINNQSSKYFAAVDCATGLLCGYSGFWLIGEEAHITTLAVHPDYRRCGIGERLLINDIEAALNLSATWILLEVRASNDSAQNLYHKYGFRSMGVRRRYYQDNDEDALVLWKESISSPEFKLLLAKRSEDLGVKKQGDEWSFVLPGVRNQSQ